MDKKTQRAEILADYGFVETENYKIIKELNKRINIVQGGTSAGKTWDIIALLAFLSFLEKDEIISVTTDTFPNLKRGALRDLQRFIGSAYWDNYFAVNKSDHTYTNLLTNTMIEFFSCDELGALGARRGYLFVNEANRISYTTFTQLEIRTRKRIWLDFNPVNEFWAHTELLKRQDTSFVKLNYMGNSALEHTIVEALEARKGDGNNNWWRVYGLGEIGSLEGNIYSGWQVVEDIPEGYHLKRYGVDFGFSNDPTAVIAIYENEAGDICLDEKLCKTKMLTPALVAELKTYEDGLFVCDNARPEIIAEMQASGIRAIGSDKTAGEKMNGKRYNIELVLRRKICYTSRSKELEREYLSYQWRKKKTGEVIDEPEDGNDHCMDAVAYGIRDMARTPIQYAGIR